MTTQEIVSKLWNLCNVLRDDGITYHQYVTELTYILFLKMAKETGAEAQIPEAYRWDVLTSKSGIELKKFYNSKATNLIRIKRNEDKYSKLNLDIENIPEFNNFEDLDNSNYLNKIGEIKHE